VNEEREDRVQLAANSSPDWATLAAKLIDDLSRMMQAEIRLAELGIRSVLQSQIDQMLETLVVGGLMLCAAICFITGAIFLFHHWLEWWQSFGLAAVLALFGALVIRSMARQPSSVVETH
jgi:Putative Actinobacterial Holin-X, holin superfamily III